MGQTDIVCTGWDKPLVHSLVAKVTFLRDVFILVKCDGVVWALPNTRPASCALFIIHHHNTIWPFFDGLFRTGLCTRGIIAVPANIHMKDKI
jgi:hypothetical protein